MANNVSFIIQLKDQFSRKANRIRDAVQAVTRKFDGFNRKIKIAGKRLSTLGKTAKKAGKNIADLGAKLIKGLTLPLAAVGTFALLQSAKIETLAVSLETLAGGAEKGKKLLKQLTEFTSTTPFQLEGVGKATVALLGFKVESEKMLPTLRLLGDLSAGANVPISEMALIFGKTRAKGKAMTEEILQFAERGIPIIDFFADKFNVSKQAVLDMASESKISFALIEKALGSMTSEGGLFFEQTKKQSQTLAGVWSTLLDNISLTSAVFGDVLVDVFNLKQGISGLSDFLGKMKQKIQDFAKNNPQLTKIIIIFAGIMAVLGPLLVLIGAAVFAFGSLAVVGGAILTMGATLLIVSGVIAGLVAAGVLLASNWDKIKNTAESLKEKVKSSFLAMKSNVVSVFLSMKNSIMEFGSSIIKFALNPIDTIIDKFTKFKGFLSSFIPGGEDLKGQAASFILNESKNIPAAELRSQENVTSRSQTDISVTLRAPDKLVESTKINGSGNRQGLSVGLNMVPAGI